MATFIKLTTERGKRLQEVFWVNTALIVHYSPNAMGSEVQVRTVDHALIATSGKIDVQETPEQIQKKLESPELELLNTIAVKLYNKIDCTELVDPNSIDFMREMQFSENRAGIHLSNELHFLEVKGIPKPVPLEETTPTHVGHLRIVRQSPEKSNAPQSLSHPALNGWQ